MMMHVSARAMARPVCVCACDTVARPASPCSFGACFGGCLRGFKRMCVWTVCAVGTQCARVFAAERQRCVYFRFDGAPVTIRSTGRGARPLAAAPGAVPGLGTMGRPFSATIQYNRVITDLSPGCRAVELSRIRRAAVEAAVEGLSRPCLSSLSSSCRVAVEPVEPDCMRDAPGRRGLSRSVELSSCRAMSSC